MSSTYPSVIASLTNPNPTDRLNSPSHSSIETAQNTEIIQIENVLGTNTTSALGTIIGDLRNPASQGGGHVQGAAFGGTGQTTFTKGDMFVAQSASVLTKLSVGQNNQVLVANSAAALGVNWAAVPAMVVTSTIAASSIWTRPIAITSTSRVFVQLWGGGGSGASGGSGNLRVAGGGGGGYNEGWFNASALSASVVVSAGAGGSGVSGFSNGNVGKITVFDVNASLLTAFAGGAGSGQNGASSGGGGGGGVFSSGGNGGASGGASGGIFASQGETGNQTPSVAYYGAGGGGGNNGTCGNGGNSYWGGSGGGGAWSSVSSAGGSVVLGGQGSGGSFLGASSGSVLAGGIPGGGGGACFGPNGTSGAGGSGKIIITTFL